MEIAFAIILTVLAVALVVTVLFQTGGKSSKLSQAISGGSSDNYIGKNKQRAKDKKFSKLTTIIAIAFVVILILSTILIYHKANKTEEENNAASTTTVTDTTTVEEDTTTGADTTTADGETTAAGETAADGETTVGDVTIAEPSEDTSSEVAE